MDDGFFADEEDTGKADSSDSSMGDQGDNANKSDKTEGKDESDKTEGAGKYDVSQDKKDDQTDASDDSELNKKPEASKKNGLEDEKKATESELNRKYDAFYNDGQICIYNYRQLQLIGSGEELYTGDKDGRIGKGNPVEVDDEVITYAEDAAYRLMNDIPLDIEEIWTVPESFAGSIGKTKTDGDEERTLYDEATDTIYIYNPYQLMILAQEDSEDEPVMTLDYDAAQFGMGQLIYSDGEDEAYLTYSKEHTYVLSKDFRSDMPELAADQLSADTSDAEGRDFKGQVIKTIGDKTYILIGNREQLEKIGTGELVNGAVYQAYKELGKWYVDTDHSGKPIMLYGGDADLKKEQNGTKDFTFDGIKDTDTSLSAEASYHIRGRCGVNQKTGNIDPYLDIEKTAEGQKYTANANYIIFRDIDFTGDNWKPLTFQGTMIGAKSDKQAEDGKLWSQNEEGEIALNEANRKPFLSNIKIEQTDKINVGEQMGVGFFSTISSEVSEQDIGLSKGLVQVANLRFENITVHTKTQETYYPPSLVSTLTNTLGHLLGGVLSGLTFLLTFGQVKIDLGKTLGDVLDARKKDPTALATGAIAGRAVGQVEFSDIEVSNANVKNINNYTGGFVGYITGTTQYDGLSHALGDLVKLLTNILNVIPGLGLGDLITILLGNAIPLEKLIPTGDINAKIVNCAIDGLNIETAKDKDYAGGFVGMQMGTIIENGLVSNTAGAGCTITGQKFVGGFVGLARDAVIEGTLSGALDIETKLPKMNTESLLLNCSLDSDRLNVSANSYVGGFAGAMANTSAANCELMAQDAFEVKAAQNYAGGFSGIAALGWAADLGKDDTKDNLLGGVVDLVVKLLSSNPGAASSLLSLGGVNPSYILGCTVSGPLQLSGADYVGGITGRGNGAYITSTKKEYLEKVSFWRNGVYTADVTTAADTPVQLTGVSSITGKNCVGGIAGSLGTASVAGLLNTTLGVASYLPFTVENVTVEGAADNTTGAFSVTAEEQRVGGGFGEAIGGSMEHVNIKNLSLVQGKNRVGGMIGLAGPGDLAGTDGGLTVNLLGLNYVLNLNHLLSLAQGVHVSIKDAHVNGITDGMTVRATGSNEHGETNDYVVGGFIGKSHSCEIEDADVKNLKEVTAHDTDGIAGGFVGSSQTGGLADVAEGADIKTLVNVNGLLTAVKYLIPSYRVCKVLYVDGGGVSADIAGGFAGEFQSGTVNNQPITEEERGEEEIASASELARATDPSADGKYYAVYNIDHVNGQAYAGGFGGNVYAGALADAGKGISILGGIKGLDIKIGDLLNLINAYVPFIQYAGVWSENADKTKNGFTVCANRIKSDGLTSGSAGGFIGYGSGVQVSYCDVSNLKHTAVTEPAKGLEDTDSASYFDDAKSTYAVSGARYAGGYIGYMNIGSAASLGKGLSILEKSIGLTDVLSALNVVVSTIEHSSVSGAAGGFAVKASGKKAEGFLTSDPDILGDAGGFAGKISGGHIQDSHAVNFSYIIGQITAGGYVGDMEPGSAASVLDETSILGGLVDTKETLASLVEDFVPTIRNSTTSCIPCGGAVRADAASTTTIQRGIAGGYAGRNEGGHIWGNNTKKWKGNDYTGPTSRCEAIRIRSVYGAEIAGGFTGRMESADTASTGSLSLLWRLVKVDNLLGALSVVYPTEEHTAVYGPLTKLDLVTWNKWVEFVGKYGGYGSELAQRGTASSQADLDQRLARYIYGYHVVAGRSNYRDETILANGGAAGGYVGSMLTGCITDGQAHQAKLIRGSRCAGGYAGEMRNGGAANLGGAEILGLKLELGQMLDILEVFVPVIKQSSVKGYQSGLSVESDGTDDKAHCGYAGGYVGQLTGGQIWGDAAARCQVTKLRRVDGRSYVGGFVGSARPGSVATVDPTAGEGLFLSKLLQKLLDTPADLIQVLNATVATIRYADVDAWDDWGIIVNGAYTAGSNTAYARAAGGFAGSLAGTVLGEKKDDHAGISAQGIRSVIGGEYAGGCFGLADVDAGVKVSGKNETELLKYLLQLGRTDVLDAFRTYIYDGTVSGSADAGLSVSAYAAQKYGQNDAVTRSGNAGGFGGALLNSSVKNSTVTMLSDVSGVNSTGGFIGYSGKSGVVDLNKVDVLGNKQWQLLGGAAGVLDVFGSHVDDSCVSGIEGGYTVQSRGGEEQIAGGFIGYANLARMARCTAGDASIQGRGLKQVSSGGTAGGFAGRTSYEYLANIDLDSTLVNALLTIVNQLVKALYLDKLQNADLLNINLGIIQIKALYEGDLLSVNLFGLKISVGLSKADTENKEQTDFAIIRIGDSVIKLPCDKDGIKEDKDTKSNISISLIKANRTKITDSKVFGIAAGYDVYAGGANYAQDGLAADGRSGGFVGFNDEGLLQNNDMFYCDVVRGTAALVGPFSGESKLDSSYTFNTKEKVEGENNNFRIYRKLAVALDAIKKGSEKLNKSYEKSGDWDMYTLGHMNTVKSYETLEDAKLESSTASGTGSVNADLNAYVSAAKAVLMDDSRTTLNEGGSDTPAPPGIQDPCDKKIQLTINKVWKDFGNFDQKRPDTITVTLYWTWTDDAGAEHTEVVPGYENFTIEGSVNQSVWQKVLEGLPAYMTEKVGEEEKIHYYTYSISEVEVDGYSTSIVKSDDGFTFTITNRHFPLLPDTGGYGAKIYILIGVLILSITRLLEKRSVKRKRGW